MIDFNPSSEQRMLRESVERFVREHHTLPEHRRLAASADGFNRAYWKTYAELGWLGLALPEEVGGLGCSLVEVAIVMEEWGRGLALEPLLSTAILCAQLVERADGHARREKILRDLAAGKLLLALAHAEQGMRFETDCVTRTVARPGGDAYRIDGAKILVLGGPSADVLIVSAVIGNEAPGSGVPADAQNAATEPYALFLVDPAASGVAIESYPLLDGTRASDLRLTNVAVAANDLLIYGDAARAALDAATDCATLAGVAQSLGCMETILEMTAAHLKTRVQFGQALAKFQALQHRMAEIFIEVEQTRSILYQGLTVWSDGANARRAAVSAAKAHAGNAAKFVGTQGVQLHGGIGVTEEAALGHYYKRLVLLEKLFGDTEYHLDRFARSRGY